MISFFIKKWKYGLYVAGFCVCISVIALSQFFLPHTTTFDPVAVLSTINSHDDIPDYLEIEQSIGRVMQEYGVRAGFELIDAGEELGIINHDACHGFLHYVGHAAYAKHKDDYESLLGIVERTECIGGYLHGIEAEIVLASDNLIEDLHSFCNFQKNKSVNPGSCYHGVGHAATELYNYDVEKSLLLCYELKSPIEDDLTNCYRGVFSEVGNAATGYDGHTGLTTEKLNIPGLDARNALVYCESFEKKYQSSCKSQILKVAQVDMAMDDWLLVCKDEKLSTETQNICVNISVGVYVRHHLSFSETAYPPPYFETLPISQQQIGILGVAEAYSGYFADKKKRDWKVFCNRVTDEVREYCNEILFRTSDGEAPWMERTDIR